MTTAGPIRPTPAGGHRAARTTSRPAERPRGVLRPAPVPSAPDATPGFVRRLVPNRGHPEHLDGTNAFAEADSNALVRAVDDATQQAYDQILTRPLFTGLEALVETSGYLSAWVESVREEADGTARAGTATARQFGYAVETLTTHLLGGSKDGWTLAYQVTAGTTRPDVVATKRDRVMWLDLTAHPSAGHIYLLKSWHDTRVCPYPHAEITYPELDAGTRAVLIGNAREEIAGRPKAGAVDTDALRAQVAAAKERHAANLARWRAAYGAAVSDRVLGARPTDLAVQDLARRDAVYDWLGRTFPGADFVREHSPSPGGRVRTRRHTYRDHPYARPGGPDDVAVEELEPQPSPEQARLAASILVALGLLPKTYGFSMASASAAQGVAFLEEHDPPPGPTQSADVVTSRA